MCGPGKIRFQEAHPHRGIRKLVWQLTPRSMNARLRTVLSLIDSPRNSCFHRVVHLAWTIFRALVVAGFSPLAGGEFSDSSGHPKITRHARRQSVADDTTSGSRLWSVCDRPRRDRPCSRPAVASPAELPLLRQAMGVLRLLPGATNCVELAVNEPAVIAGHAPLAGERHCGSNFQRFALAESCAGAFDIDRGHGHGVDVRARAKYSAAGSGTSIVGLACVVGVSNRMAPHVAGRTGLLLSVLKGLRDAIASLAPRIDSRRPTALRQHSVSAI